MKKLKKMPEAQYQVTSRPKHAKDKPRPWTSPKPSMTAAICDFVLAIHPDKVGAPERLIRQQWREMSKQQGAQVVRVQYHS